jgi:hypothetical protein
MFRPTRFALLVVLVALLAGCEESPADCPPSPVADLSEAAAWAADDRFPFRFPLDDPGEREWPAFVDFCGSRERGSELIHHAAEDFFKPPGTPVYAMADGRVSFSGPMGGYGWLVIVDHPQINLYSLYGHLSPSRWRIEPGPVRKGELLGHLGDDHENGGSADKPLVPHLHLGVRAGQRSDYSGVGQWRWQAGWITHCPMEIGWLQPSLVISSQEVPAGGFPDPPRRFLAAWGVELLLAGIYLFCGACMLVFAIKRDKPLVLVIAGGFLIVAGLFVLRTKGMAVGYVLLAMALLFLIVGVYRLARRVPARPEPDGEETAP